MADCILGCFEVVSLLVARLHDDRLPNGRVRTGNEKLGNGSKHAGGGFTRRRNNNVLVNMLLKFIDYFKKLAKDVNFNIVSFLFIS